MDTHVVTIDLGHRSYDIYIGQGLLARINDYLPMDVARRKVFIVTDAHVQHYAQELRSAMHALGVALCEVYVLPSGESVKSYDSLMVLHGWMLDHTIHRNSIVMAVGGGVVGDLAGFAAATVLRGVPYIQVPTTLLSQVDSSVGGKTGINTRQGKNLVGAFYQPQAVIADIVTLTSLPRREILAGYAEIVKYGLLGDYDFFAWLEEFGSEVVALKDYALARAIETSCRKKAQIVEADEKEGGIRALLNLGHTFGHALEAAAGYNGTLLHGEAVAIGMVMAFDLSVRMNLCERGDMDRVITHFRSVGLPVYASEIMFEAVPSIDALIETMRKDKKTQDDKMTFIVVNAIGEAFITKDVPEHLVRAVLAESLAGGQV